MDKGTAGLVPALLGQRVNNGKMTGISLKLWFNGHSLIGIG
jgi:hypothetical protein